MFSVCILHALFNPYLHCFPILTAYIPLVEPLHSLLHHYPIPLLTLSAVLPLCSQGNDVGTQYASVIFTHTPTQEDEAREVLNELQSMLDKKAITFVGAKFAGDKVATRIKSAQTFYAAEDDHQMYLFKNPGGYCNHGIRFVWDVKEVSGASQ